MFREASSNESLNRDAKSAGRNRDLRPLRQLLPYLAPYRLQILLAAIALLAAAGLMLSIGRGLQTLIDKGLMTSTPAMLDHTLVIMLAVVAGLAVASYARYTLVSWIGEKVVADLRRDVFNHLIKLEPSYYEMNKPGELISRLTTDTSLLQTIVGTSVSIALRNALMMIGGLLMMFWTSWQLALLAVLAVPVVVASIVISGRRVRHLSKENQDKIGDLGAQLDETLHAIRTVQSYTREPEAAAVFGSAVDAALGSALRRIQARGVMAAVIIFVVFAAIALMLWQGGHQVIGGTLSGGALSAFVFYAGLVAGAVGALSEVMGDLQRAAGASERLFGILATLPAIRAPANALPLPLPVKGAVSFEAVQFSYPSRPGEKALDNFSLNIKPAETLALVGPSGGGKSTVFQLLLRFYDPQSGRITLDGIALPDMDPREFRAHIGLVSQDPVIFSGTVRENIAFGRPDASEDEIQAAAKAAYATEFIDRLPDRFGAVLGERGVRLSGGQRQRIAIARAVLRNPRVLLLDEATSALDAESERAVQAALETLMDGRTTLVIAHRLATVQSVKRIIVLDHGQITAEGDHQSLVAGGGLYARLASLQFQPGKVAAE